MDDHSFRAAPRAPAGAGEPASTGIPIRVVAAVVWRGDRVLLTRRPPGGAHPLMWEFPGGKLEAGESAEQALVRELREELGVEATPGERLGVGRHAYSAGLAVEITFVRCELADAPLVPSAAVHALRWVRPAEIDLDDVLAADRAFIASLSGAAPDGTGRVTRGAAIPTDGAPPASDPGGRS